MPVCRWKRRGPDLPALRDPAGLDREGRLESRDLTPVAAEQLGFAIESSKAVFERRVREVAAAYSAGEREFNGNAVRCGPPAGRPEFDPASGVVSLQQTGFAEATRPAPAPRTSTSALAERRQEPARVDRSSQQVTVPRAVVGLRAVSANFRTCSSSRSAARCNASDGDSGPTEPPTSTRGAGSVGACAAMMAAAAVQTAVKPGATHCRFGSACRTALGAVAACTSGTGDACPNSGHAATAVSMSASSLTGASSAVVTGRGARRPDARRGSRSSRFGRCARRPLWSSSRAMPLSA